MSNDSWPSGASTRKGSDDQELKVNGDKTSDVEGQLKCAKCKRRGLLRPIFMKIKTSVH